MSIDLHFTGEDWERIERDWSAWWAGELERPLVLIEGQELPSGAAQLGIIPPDSFLPFLFPLDEAADRIIDAYQRSLEVQRFYGDAFPHWWPNFGPGIMAGFLGAEVCPKPETVWFEPVETTSIEHLHLSFDPHNVWWRRVQELTRLAVERWGDQVAVGHTDIGGNLDILASLRTTRQLLYDTTDAPAEVARLSAEITRLWLRCYDELWATIQQAGRGTTPWLRIWSPGRCYALQSDFSYMISPKMFERFVMPDLAACCQALDHAFYHLDGKGQIAHLDMLLSLERLRGIQWVPGDGSPPPEEWLPLLKRIRDSGKRCHVCVSPAGALTIVRELGGRGFALHISRLMRQEEAQDFLKMVIGEST